MEFGNRLSKLRKKRNVSQVNLSVACEVSQETISTYENNKNMPSCEVLVKIANYLGTTTDYLLCRTNSDVSIYQLSNNGITDDDAEILCNLKLLTPQNKAKVLGYIEALKK